MNGPRIDRTLLSILSALGLLGMTASTPVRPAPEPQGQGVLSFLEPLIGSWAPDADEALLRRRPELRDQIVHHYEWMVGRQAIRILEGYPRGRPDDAELQGMIYWDPATQRAEFIAVAGHDEGQGRLFRGEYLRLSDGRIERVYDVHYRTPADMPGEELGGTRRRYREIHTIGEEGRVSVTLDWWRDGRWQPFAIGRYAMKRASP